MPDVTLTGDGATLADALGDPVGPDELEVLPPALGDPVGADECAEELEVLPPGKTNLYTNTPATANTAMTAMTTIGVRDRRRGDPAGG